MASKKLVRIGLLLLFILTTIFLGNIDSSSAKKKKVKRVKVAKTYVPSIKNKSLDLSITIPDVEYVESLAYKRMKNTGAKFTRITIFWNRVAPSVEPRSWNPTDPNSPYYNWTDYDRQIKEAVDAGLVPLVQIFAAPSWAEQCAIPGEPGICNPNTSKFAHFTYAAVKRYDGSAHPKVSYWQPWNEPNLHIFFKPQKIGSVLFSPILYKEMLKTFSFVVKGLDPSNKVVAGGLAPLGGKNSVGPLAFTKSVLCLEGRGILKQIPNCEKLHFDIWTMNPYTTGGPTRRAKSPDDVQLGDLRELVKVIKTAKTNGTIVSSKQVPVWITEFSWDTKPPDPKGLPMKIHTRWVSEALYRAWDAGVSNFFWFSLRDWRLTPGESYADNLESGL